MNILLMAVEFPLSSTVSVVVFVIYTGHHQHYDAYGFAPDIYLMLL